MKRKIEEPPFIDGVNLGLVMEVVAENVPQLDRGSLGALRATNRFFATSPTFETMLNTKPWCTIAAGASHTVLLTHDKRLYFCGNNNLSQLGDSEEPLSEFTPIHLALLKKDDYIIQVATGRYHTFLLSNQGQLLGAGFNEKGALGCYSYNEYEDEFVIITIKGIEDDERIICMQSGESHTVLLTNRGRVFGSGDNDCGQLGLSSNVYYYHSFELCDLVLNDNERVIKVVAGIEQTLLLTNQNRLLVDGLNENKLLGVSNEGRIHIDGVEEAVFVQGFEAATIKGLAEDEYLVDVSIEESESFLLTNKGKLLGCYDEDEFDTVVVKELQEGEVVSKLVSAMGGHHTFILTNKGRLLAAGKNNWGQLGLPQTIEQTLAFKPVDLSFLMPGEIIIDVILGEDYSLLLTNRARVFGCGCNVDGQLSQPLKDKVFGFQECNLEAIKNHVRKRKYDAIEEKENQFNDENLDRQGCLSQGC